MRLGIDGGVLITGEGLLRGVEAPEFDAIDLVSGRNTRLRELRGHRVVLVFIEPSCGSCRSLVPHINEVAPKWAEVQFLAVCSGTEAACQELARDTRLRVPLLRDSSDEIAQNYAVRSTPFAYLLDEEGTVLIRGIVNTWPQLEALLAERGTLRTGVSLEEVILRQPTLERSAANGGAGHAGLTLRDESVERTKAAATNKGDVHGH